LANACALARDATSSIHKLCESSRYSRVAAPRRVTADRTSKIMWRGGAERSRPFSTSNAITAPGDAAGSAIRNGSARHWGIAHYRFDGSTNGSQGKQDRVARPTAPSSWNYVGTIVHWPDNPQRQCVFPRAQVRCSGSCETSRQAPKRANGFPTRELVCKGN